MLPQDPHWNTSPLPIYLPSCIQNENNSCPEDKEQAWGGLQGFNTLPSRFPSQSHFPELRGQNDLQLTGFFPVVGLDATDVRRFLGDENL